MYVYRRTWPRLFTHWASNRSVCSAMAWQPNNFVSYTVVLQLSATSWGKKRNTHRHTYALLYKLSQAARVKDLSVWFVGKSHTICRKRATSVHVVYGWISVTIKELSATRTQANACAVAWMGVGHHYLNSSQLFRTLVTPKVSGGHLQCRMVLSLPTGHLLLREDIITRDLLLQWVGINTKELLLPLLL